MKTAVFIAPGKMTIAERPKPTIQHKNDAIIRVLRASVCGSDFWWYRGTTPKKPANLLDAKPLGLSNPSARG